VAALVATANGAPGYVHADDGYVHADERHGAFWAFVLRGLRGAAGIKDGKVTAAALARYVTEATRSYVAGAYKGMQTPVLVDPTGKAADAALATPDTALLALAEGDAFFENREFAKAAEKYGQAFALRKDLVEAYLRQAEAYIRGAEGPRAVADYDAAINDCNEAMRLDPGNPDALDFRGDGHFFKAGKLSGMNQDEMIQAVRDYSAAIALDPDFPPSFNSLGSARGSLAMAYARQKMTDQSRAEDEQAVAAFSRAIELAPRRQSSYFENRARALRRLKQYDQSAADYTAALGTGEKLDSESLFRLRYSRGRVHLLRNDFAQAGADFAEAARLKPDDPDALRYLRSAREKAAELKRRGADRSD
jgi:tetratricopeptide (TPR) repeat protein